MEASDGAIRCDIPNRRVGEFVGQGRKRDASVFGLENASGRGPDVHNARIGFDHGDVIDAAAGIGRTDVAEGHRGQGILQRRIPCAAAPAERIA